MTFGLPTRGCYKEKNTSYDLNRKKHEDHESREPGISKGDDQGED